MDAIEGFANVSRVHHHESGFEEHCADFKDVICCAIWGCVGECVIGTDELTCSTFGDIWHLCCMQSSGGAKGRAGLAAAFSDVETDSEAPFTSDSDTDAEGMHTLPVSMLAMSLCGYVVVRCCALSVCQGSVSDSGVECPTPHAGIGGADDGSTADGMRTACISVDGCACLTRCTFAQCCLPSCG
jgi:hypothetical protein